MLQNFRATLTFSYRSPLQDCCESSISQMAFRLQLHSAQFRIHGAGIRCPCRRRGCQMSRQDISSTLPNIRCAILEILRPMDSASA